MRSMKAIKREIAKIEQEIKQEELNQLKTCNHCKKARPVKEFPTLTLYYTKADGKQVKYNTVDGRCRLCRNQYQRDRKKKIQNEDRCQFRDNGFIFSSDIKHWH